MNRRGFIASMLMALAAPSVVANACATGVTIAPTPIAPYLRPTGGFLTVAQAKSRISDVIDEVIAEHEQQPTWARYTIETDMTKLQTGGEDKS